MSSSAQLLWLTVTTVARVMLIAAAGAAAQTRLSAPARSVRGMSYLSLHIFLPCLLFSNLSSNTTWDGLAKFYWAPVFAILTTLVGFASSMVLRSFFASQFAGILVLVCTFQNGLTFPLGLVYSIHGLSWLTPHALAQCESYIFLYNIISTTALFVFGDTWIAYCSRKETEEKARAAAAAEAAALAALGGKSRDERAAAAAAAATAAGGDGGGASHMALAARQLQWYRPASAAESLRAVMSLRYSGQQQQGGSSSSGGAWALVTQVTSSPPVASSVLGVVVGLTPPLRWLMLSSPPGRVLMGALAAIGEATLVMQLIILGCTMSRTLSTRPTPSAADSNNNDNDDMTAVDATTTTTTGRRRWWWPRRVTVSQHTRLVIVTLVLRLVCIPLLCFAILHLLRRAHFIPDERPFLFAMLLEFCAPSAVNATLLCLMHNYHENECAAIIFVMYMASIVSMACWLFVYVLYLGP